MKTKPPRANEKELVHYYPGPHVVAMANGGRGLCNGYGLVSSYKIKVTCRICVKQLLNSTLRTKDITNT